MKIRKDFVTNSSSSSFVISKDAISLDKLFDILIELANTEEKEYGHQWTFTRDDIDNNTIGKYRVRETTEKYIYNTEGEFILPELTKYYDGINYTNHYIIDNEGMSRYPWYIIDGILSKYNIPWNYGYCD